MLLKKAENETAYLSTAIYGFAGSGKSFTGACIAIGLYAYIKSKGSIAYLDTEAGSDFLLPHFRHNNIDIVRSKSRAFVDVIPTMKEAIDAGAEIIIIDSCTHLWMELCNAYEKKYERKKGLQFQDWKNVKGEWNEFMTAVLNLPLHTILLGRAGYEYDYVDIEGDGKKTLVKTKTKMRAEGQTEHEPSITLEMEQVTLTDDEIRVLAIKQKAGVSTKVTGQFSHYMMYILKDRCNMLTGSVFKYPPIPGVMIEPDNKPFTDILPFIQAINIGGQHAGVDTSRSSENMFNGPDHSYTERKREREILIEKILNELTKKFGGTHADKLAKLQCLEKYFGTNSWIEITEKVPMEILNKGFRELMYGPEQPAGDASGDKPAQRPHETESKAPEAIPDENGCKIIYEQIKHEGNPKRRQNAFEALVGSAVYDRESDPAGTAPFIEQGKFFDAATQIMKLRGWI